MFRLVRTLLLWFMIAALPLQGMAAAATITYGPMHGHMMKLSIHAAVASEMRHYDIAAMHKHGGTQHAALDHKHADSCSSCVACCMGGAVAPPMSLNQPSSSPLSETDFVPVTMPAAEFIQTGPERPPRRISA